MWQALRPLWEACVSVWLASHSIWHACDFVVLALHYQMEIQWILKPIENLRKTMIFIRIYCIFGFGPRTGGGPFAAQGA